MDDNRSLYMPLMPRAHDAASRAAPIARDLLSVRGLRRAADSCIRRRRSTPWSWTATCWSLPRTTVNGTTVLRRHGNHRGVARRSHSHRLRQDSRPVPGGSADEGLLPTRAPGTAVLRCSPLLGPASIAAATTGVVAITDDRPSIEFHPPRHRVSRYKGGMNVDQARAMELIHVLKLKDPPPVDHATAEEMARIAAERDGRLADARRLAEQGLASAPDDRNIRAFLGSLPAATAPRCRGHPPSSPCRPPA